MPFRSWLASLVQRLPRRSRTAVRSQRCGRGTHRAALECLESRLALTISAIANQVIPEDGTVGPLNFRIAEDDTAAADLMVTATAADPGLIPASNVTLQGTGALRTLSLTPAPNVFGTTLITISAGRAGETSETRTFSVTIQPRNDAPSVSGIADQTVLMGTPTAVLPFLISDLETATRSLQVTAMSSNPAVVPVENVVLGGTEEARSVQVTPLPLQFGETTITLTVTDPGGAIRQMSFNVIVTTAALTYDLAENDSISISANGSKVVTRINGTLDQTYATVPVEKVGLIRVTGGTGANVIDLSGLSTDQYRRLTSISVNGGDGNDSIIGGQFSESLSGGNGDDVVDGGEGADLLSGGNGSDTIRGGAGLDRITEVGDFDMILSKAALEMRLPTGQVVWTDQLVEIELADITGGPSRNRIDARGFVAGANGITQIIGGGSVDTVIGTPGRDLIFTFSYNDVIFGGSGDDTIFSGGGNDTVHGESGDDQVFGQLGNDVIYGVDGNDSLMGGDGSDTLFGQAGNDHLFGMRENDRLFGGDGDDYLFGDNGNNVLNGERGNDVIICGIGTDSIDGGTEYDRILLVADGTFVVTPDSILSPFLGVKKIAAVDRVQITGGQGNNIIDAGSATVSVVLIGLEGDDTLIGGGRNDILIGNEGNDVLVSNGGPDVYDGGPGRNLITPELPRIAVIGDSTVSTFILPTNGDPPLEGWAQELDEFFRRDGAAIVNSAVSGRSLKSFRLEGRWQSILESRPEAVLIQFGHNDQLFAGPTRGSDPNGEFQDILRSYIQEARAANIVPILVTPVSVRFFINGVARESVALTPYANAMRQVAEELGVALVDLNRASFNLYRQLGAAGSEFISHTPTDIAHFSPAGANVMSGLVVNALRQVAPQLVPLMRS